MDFLVFFLGEVPELTGFSFIMSTGRILGGGRVQKNRDLLSVPVNQIQKNVHNLGIKLASGPLFELLPGTIFR